MMKIRNTINWNIYAVKFSFVPDKTAYLIMSEEITADNNF